MTATATESWPFPDEKVDLTRQHGHPRKPPDPFRGFLCEDSIRRLPVLQGLAPAGGVTQIHPHFGPTRFLLVCLESDSGTDVFPDP